MWKYPGGFGEPFEGHVVVVLMGGGGGLSKAFFFADSVKSDTEIR